MVYRFRTSAARQLARAIRVVRRRRRASLGVLAGLVTFTLIGGLLTQVVIAVVSSAESISATHVAPLSSGVGKVATPPLATGAGVQSAMSARGLVAAVPAAPHKLVAPVKKSTFNPKTSKVVSRSAYATVYRNVDGSSTKVIAPYPLNVRRSDGSWVPVGTVVERSTKSGVLTVADNPLSPVFVSKLAGAADLRIDSGESPVSVSLVGAAPVGAEQPKKAVFDGGNASSEVVYPNALPGQDLQYAVSAGQVKETVLLSSLPSQSSWVWRVHAPGLSLSKAASGSLLLTDAAGVVKYTIPTPLITDSSGVAGKSEPALEDVPTSFSQETSGDWLVTLTPDRSWVTDPARVFPLMIDPTFTAGLGGETAYRSDGASDTTGIIRTGNPRVSNGDQEWRTVACYPYGAVTSGNEITSGSNITMTYSGGNAPSTTGLISYATAFSFNGVGQGIINWSMGTSGTTAASGAALDAQYQSWINAGSTGTECLMWTGVEANGSYTYKSLLNTALNLNYEAAPTVTQRSPSPTNGGRGAVMPILAVSATNPAGGAENYLFRISSNANPDTSPAWDSGWTSQSQVQVPKTKLTPGVTYYWKGYVQDVYGAVRATSVQSFTANSPGVVSQVGATPGTSAPLKPGVISTLTPTLSVPGGGTDANGDALQYQFRITSGSDGVSGQVASSAWGSALSWQVPAGVLQDGGSYTWTVLTNDGFDTSYLSWVNHFRIDQRITSSGPAPTDSVGPVTVNLANGNVSAGFTSPTVSTLGGAMGLAFNYNSQTPSNAGLTGSYYNATAPGGTGPVFAFPSANPAQLVRTDSQLSFDWSTQGPGPSVSASNFLAQWNGYVTTPFAGNFTFGLVANDGAKLFLGGSTTATLDKWAANKDTTTTWAASSSSLAAGPTPINVQYYFGQNPTDTTDTAHLQLWVKFTDPNTGLLVSELVPGTWFSRSIQTLPGGWAGSQPLLGDEGDYTSAQVNEGSVVLTDTSGVAHTYSQTLTAAGAPSSGYTPPDGEDGVVSVSPSKQVTFTDGAGTVYQFDASGHVISVNSPADNVSKPANPVPRYASVAIAGGTVSVLRAVADPLSADTSTPPNYSRQVLYGYAGDTASTVGLTGTGPACATPAAPFATAPVGMICVVVYPDGTSTQLLYGTNGQLARVIDPGNQVTDFGYTQAASGSWLLSSVRSSLANDWLAADSTRNASGPVSTTISYDSQNRATSVTLPAPDGVTVAKQPQKTYTYASGATGSSNGTSYVDVAGELASSTGHARTVTFNQGLQQVTDVSPSGLTSSSVWAGTDDRLASISPQGSESSTVFDQADRGTDSYGPVPSSCFAAQAVSASNALGSPVPSASCPVTPAHSTTSYDGGLNGLNAVWYNNATMTGTPAGYSLSTGDTGGVISHDWPTGASPAPGGATTGWTAQFTGLITFPTAGTYTLYTYADDGTQLWLNDTLVLDNWVTASAHYAAAIPFTATAGQVARIRMNYYQNTGPAHLELDWATPGNAVPTVASSNVAVPGADLAPAYGLVTSATSADSVPTGIAGVMNANTPSAASLVTYVNPWLGTVASTFTVASASQTLISTVTTEAPGTGYLRVKSATKPAGAGTTSTNAYYPATTGYGTVLGLSAAVCGVPLTTPQFGMLQSVTGPTPATGAAAVTSYVYDVLGRVAGALSPGDTVWTCTSYDSRGRVASVSYPAYGAAAARTVTYGYTADGTATGDPLTTWVQDGNVVGSPNGGRITSVENLDGQSVSYTDVWNTVTTNAYNQLGQLTSTASTPVGGSAQTEAYTYNPDGQQLQVSENGNVIASETYGTSGATSGLLTGISYPSGSGNAGNGTSLTNVNYSPTGALVGKTWQFAAGQNSIVESNALSQSGKIVQDTIADGTTPFVFTYGYDGADRLVQATIPDNSLTYTYATTSGCGVNTAAGADGNRTSWSDTVTGGTGASATPVSMMSCYDNADRLTSDTVTGATAGADTLLSTNLSSTGTANLVYDSHGNTTVLANEAMGYDDTNRHLTTSLPDGTTVTYVRDVGDRVAAMTTSLKGAAATTVKYSDLPDGNQLVLNSAGAVQEESCSLPGGVTGGLTLDFGHSYSSMVLGKRESRDGKEELHGRVSSAGGGFV